MSAGGAASRQRRKARRAAARAAGEATTPIIVRASQEQLADVHHVPAELSPARQALKLVTEFADGDQMEPCADCGDAYDAHEGDGGACTVDGCSCMSYAAPDMAAAVVVSLDEKRLLAHATKLLSETTGTGGVGSTMTIRLTDFVINGFSDTTNLTSAVAELPVEHAPGETLPERNPSPAPPAVGDRRGPLEWTATLVPEGVLTDDGRAFAPGSVSWRELPLTLMAMIETSEIGHTGAQVSGRIDRIWREGNLVKAAGVFDDGEFGLDIARMVGDGTLRGISVDVAVHDRQIGPRSDFFDDDGNWIDQPPDDDKEPPNILDILFGGDEEMVVVVTDGVIGAATVCPFPAFADADIALAASLVASVQREDIWTFTHQAGFTVIRRPEPRIGIEAPADGTVVELSGDAPLVVTASAAGLAPVKPPAEWFADPGFEELTALTVDDDGRVYGHAWAWNSCHTGFPDACVTAPHSQQDYAYFHLGEIECEDGSRVTCGKITLDTGHADRHAGRADATAHYDNTGTVVAHVVCGEDEHGGWIAGALHSEVDEDKARLLRGAVLSGDWRNVNGHLELVALLAVNVPGFPVPRGAKATIVASGDDQSVVALVAAGLHAGTTDEERLARVAQLGLTASVSRLLDRARA